MVGGIPGAQAEATKPTIATVGVEGMMKIYSKQYGINVALATRIIECESKFDPHALRVNKTKAGVVWSEDVGYGQINSYYWQEKLKKLGFDMYNPDQNLQATFYLMHNYGYSLWSWSRPCWG